MLTLSRPARRVLLLLIAFTVLCAGPTPARAERPNTPLSILKQAPYQLEVTVLSIELKDGPSRSKGVWHRVRVDRVLVAPAPTGPIKPGDVLAVVSTVYTLAPGTVGGTGDRGTFKGPNGLPTKGDRARLYANAAKDSPGTLTPIPPSGWQPVEPVIALIGADANAQAERTMPLLAALISANKLGTPALHLAAACDGRGGDGPAKPDAKRCLTHASALRYAGDVVVLAVEHLAPDHNTALALDDALRTCRPLVALRSSINTYADSPFGAETFGSAANAAQGTSTRVLPPDADAAAHPILAGIRIPAHGLLLPSPALEVDPLPADCRVLLWGEPGQGKDIIAPRRPVLWVRERPRALPPSAKATVALPPQRIAVTTLSAAADFDNPEVRALVLRMIAWAGSDEARLDPPPASRP